MSSTRRPSVLDALSPWLLAALILAGAWVVQPFRIPSESMRDTLQVDDYLLVSKWDFGLRVPMTRLRLPALHDPDPGEVIVFRYPRDPREDYVKRCVAVGGQQVELRDKELRIDGRPVDEPYVIHTDE